MCTWFIFIHVYWTVLVFYLSGSNIATRYLAHFLWIGFPKIWPADSEIEDTSIFLYYQTPTSIEVWFRRHSFISDDSAMFMQYLRGNLLRSSCSRKTFFYSFIKMTYLTNRFVQILRKVHCWWQWHNSCLFIAVPHQVYIRVYQS